MHKSFFKIFFSLFVMICLSGCETAEQDAINKAQDCLDEATGSEALACVDMVNGIERPEAYVIRCSAQFISEGITATRMADAFNAKDDENGSASGSPLLGMMGILSFSNATKATTTESYCNKTGLKSFQQFGTMVNMSTTIASASPTLWAVVQAAKEGGALPTQAQVETAVAEILADPTPETTEALGASAVSMSADYCSDPANATNEICVKIDTAQTNGDSNQAIGLALLQALQTKSTP